MPTYKMCDAGCDLGVAVDAMILERQRKRTADYATRITTKAAERQTFKRRRDAGLERRHARKLARIAQAEKLV